MNKITTNDLGKKVIATRSFITDDNKIVSDRTKGLFSSGKFGYNILLSTGAKLNYPSLGTVQFDWKLIE